MIIPKKLSLAIGNFDGLHLGHQAVLHESLSKVSGCCATAVLTFAPHPKQFMSARIKIKSIYPQEKKITLLRKYGVNYLLIADFNAELFQLSALDFIRNILVKQLRCQSLITGSNFKFGKGQEGNAKTLQNAAQRYGFSYKAVNIIKRKPYIVSSTVIKRLLQYGMIRQVNRLLGRAYNISGKVVLGKQLGRKIGFKTANLYLSTDLALPVYGVYYTQVTIINNNLKVQKIQGIVNIGLRPTVCDDAKVLLEVHLLDFSDDIYDQHINVEFICFIRPERKFINISTLQTQIQKDIKDVLFIARQSECFISNLEADFK